MTACRAQHAFQSRASVAHTQTQPVVNATGSDADNARGPLRFDAVLDGVFDERLQNECGHVGVEQSGVNGLPNAQAFSETRLLDSEVAAEKIHFAAECDFLFAFRIERRA